MYIPSKPGKYGIKVWAACDAKNGYICNAQVYTGKTGAVPEKNQGQCVVLEMCGPFLGKGRTITCDNFFTSYDLAMKLLEKKTCIVGTVRKSRKFLPKEFQVKSIPLGNRIYLFSGLVTLLNFGDKKQKSVVLLSTLHNIESEEEGKPEIVTYYNQSKAGVDIADQVIRFYSCKRGTRRWPLSLFYNCIDIAALNAYIIYCIRFPEFLEKEKKNARRNFLFNLSTALMEINKVSNIEINHIPYENCFNNERKRCPDCPQKPGVKTSMICSDCNKPCCKSHCVVICHHCICKRL